MFSLLKHILVFLIISFAIQLHGQGINSYHDGPYIFETNDSLNLFWISKGKKQDSILAKSEPFVFSKDSLPFVSIESYDSTDTQSYSFDNVSKIAAISDVHGQYDLMIKLLEAHGVIDSSLQWSFGDGHLVIVGDIFDRGPKVTECLWLIYQLEEQAKKSGGRLHFLLGNHELMVLHGDIRYVAPKYRYTMGVSQIPYPKLFDDNSILGKWLRKKPIFVRINGIGFVHGGFSESVIEKENNINTLNTLFIKDIVPTNGIAEDSTSLLSELYFDNGPLWYRGYANPEGFDSIQLNYILDRLSLNSLVVGHTSMPIIVSRNNNKIFLIDSSIKFGKCGEILICENDRFYRARDDGFKEEIIGNPSIERGNTTFQYIYDQEPQDLTVRLDTDLRKLFSTDKEVYQPASLTVFHKKEQNQIWNIRIRLRGNMRKQVCKFPPLKIDFAKSDLMASGYDSNDKLNLILACSDSKSMEQAIFKEEMIYQLYHDVDSLGLRSRLVNVELYDRGKLKYEISGFFVEDDANFETRTDAQIIEKGVISSAGLDREMYLKMGLFQYMIRNTDWSISNRHNVKIVHDRKSLRVRAIPYDFDYSGVINQPYAVPFEKYPISKVTIPYFVPKLVHLEELQYVIPDFLLIRKSWERKINKSKQLDKKSKKRFKKYFDDFYEKLEDETKWKKAFKYLDK